jgi:hypothetical protein
MRCLNKLIMIIKIIYKHKVIIKTIFNNYLNSNLIITKQFHLEQNNQFLQKQLIEA